MTYHIFENYLQYIKPEIFIFSFEDKLNKNNYFYSTDTKNSYANNPQPKINNNPYINISYVELLFKTNSD